MVAKILELGDLAPEMIPVRINRLDEITSATTTVTLMAYKFGPRCPVVKKVELAQIRQRYIKISEEELGLKNSISAAYLGAYVRDVILAMIQGLTFEEADLIAADDTKTVSIMEYLGIWQPSKDETESDDQGEVKADQ